MDRQTLIIVGSSTALGFIGDCLTYSIAASSEGHFKFRVPKGKDLVLVLASGIIGGFIIDWAVRKIEEAVESEEEKALRLLYTQELDKIHSGQVTGEIPTKILWKAAS